MHVQSGYGAIAANPSSARISAASAVVGRGNINAVDTGSRTDPYEFAMKRKSKAQLRVELLNVGHGDAVILHWTPEKGSKSTVLVDGGPTAGGRKIADTLGTIGADAVDLAVLTHCDADHVDGLLDYARQDDRLPIKRYWGPCLPAFERHGWLFPKRIKRGLDQTEALQRALGVDCEVSWPLEGAAWTSSDGGLSIKVLSPAARLIERLLIGEDSLSLFLEQPTPLGWLLAEAAEPPLEDVYADLRAAIATNEITPRVMPMLPPVPRLDSAEEFASQAAARGVDPEFFGNAVLNDTSIVLLVEARVGVVQRRLLLTGDLENFTYLMARWPMGLGCEIVKAPHHGSFSFVDREPAYDAVWQWLRPRAALVSANGKHGLPRTDFRDAALRYGATLFCTSRRSREIVSGPTTEACCHTQYACDRSQQAPVSLVVTQGGIESDGVACARGNISGVMPVIEVRQHLVEPSPILSSLAESEIRKHIDWAVKWLRDTHRERRSRPASADMQAISLTTMRKAAVAAGRLAASIEMETILERAAREGKVWLSPFVRYPSDERQVWAAPTSEDITALKAWVDRYIVVQLAVGERRVASGLEELLFAADTSWLSDRLAEDQLFPGAMFGDMLWPMIARYLQRTRTVGVRTLSNEVVKGFGAGTIMVLCKGLDLSDAVTRLMGCLQSLDRDSAYEYLESSADIFGSRQTAQWPDALSQCLSPLWLGRDLPPSGFMVEGSRSITLTVGGLSDEDCREIKDWRAGRSWRATRKTLSPDLVAGALTALTLAEFDIVKRPS
jgi:beta-lactamase superfamily II metal-dependent hydrolase